MIQKNTIIKGAFVLTLTGVTTRFMGFFYRIFLSRAFGEESVGLYQLAFPVYALCFSLCAAGIETAIARSTAAGRSQRDGSRTRAGLYSGFSLSLLLAFALMLFIQKEAGSIALRFLGEPRCAPLLVILSLALPFSVMHSCIYGYYIGRKHTKVPALSQLLEQAVRVGAVTLLYWFFMERSIETGIALAAAGIVAGEAAAALYCLGNLRRAEDLSSQKRLPFGAYKKGLREILSLAVPLTGSRVLLNILQNVEAVSIPARLQSHGLSAGEALSTYGVLTGMALPCVLFPSALTNSIATMLLPAVAEIQVSGDIPAMKRVIKRVFFCCFSLGLLFCLALVVTGNFIGRLLFHSAAAGHFIITLAWMCPFLYTNGCLLGILNGLGKTNISFAVNVTGLLLRIGSVFLLIPVIGIQGYLWGLLASQAAVFALCLAYLRFFFFTL